MAKMTRAKIEKSLIEQLKAKKADIDVFTDLISDYCEMWIIKNALQDDIAENGIKIDGRANPSVKELRDTQKQMLALIKQLGIDTDKMALMDDNDEL